MAPSCVLCGACDVRHFVTGYDRMYARTAPFEYVRCTRCGLVRQHPAPDERQRREAYPPDYHARIQPIERNLDKPINRLAARYFYGVDSVSRPRALRAVFRLLSGRILRGIREPHGANRVLDVGCGAGNELDVYRRLGWVACGIEISPSACARCRARGLIVHEGSVFDAPFGPEFDLVLLSHVIEHVPDPVALLHRAGQFLAPGGIIVLRTPNIAGLGFTLYRSRWYGLDAPRHLLLFDPRTMHRLAARAELSLLVLRTLAEPALLAASQSYARGSRRRACVPARRPALRQAQGAGAARPSRAETQAPLPLRNDGIDAHPSRLFRNAIAPLAWLAARVGRGEVLEAELARASL